MKKWVLYSEANYAAIVRKNGYFVDKTEYLEKLETVTNPVFLRPRRFGKSLLCSIQRYYYDLNHADQFEELSGHNWRLCWKKSSTCTSSLTRDSFRSPFFTWAC
ncbi:MAG: AAA family ATPase [Candidatus Electrothrix communis]|nr:MAG: AAA family ATPase [Candidatus Electrothrix communis]